MSFIGKLVGGLTGAKDQAKAAVQAGETQAASYQAGIDEEKRQFDFIQNLLQPFVQAGGAGLNGQLDLAGLNGAAPQQGAISALQAGPQFQSMRAQGENSILQNASATGGLRGGNVQSALAQFSPQLLAQLIEQQYGRLGGLTGVGLGAATQTGNFGQNSTNNIANLLGQQGAARAGGQLATGSVARTGFNDFLKIGSSFLGGF